MMIDKFSAEDEKKRQAEHQVLRAIHEISYGSIQVVIHDSRIVQIECTRKIRLDPRQRAPRPGHD